MFYIDKILYFILYIDNRRKDREDRFFATLHFLIENAINFPVCKEARRTENYSHCIDIIEVVFAGIDDITELFGSTGSKEVDRVCHRRAREKFCEQFLSFWSANSRHFESVIREHIGKHYSRATGMSDDSHILTFHFRVHKYGANIYKFETVATANDTGFTEKSVDSDVGSSQSTGMRRGCAATGRRASGLDSGNFTSFTDKRRGMLK